jgi:hypothetical protein
VAYERVKPTYSTDVYLVLASEHRAGVCLTAPVSEKSLQGLRVCKFSSAGVPLNLICFKTFNLLVYRVKLKNLIGNSNLRGLRKRSRNIWSIFCLLTALVDRRRSKSNFCGIHHFVVKYIDIGTRTTVNNKKCY